jgi:hypothetical protein
MWLLGWVDVDASPHSCTHIVQITQSISLACIYQTLEILVARRSPCTGSLTTAENLNAISSILLVSGSKRR